MFPTNDELFNLMILKGATGGAVVEATATGNPLTFITDKAKPLKSLLIPFTPQQEGSGDPSPENIRPILPWDGLTVFGGGKNLFDESEYQHIYTDPDCIWEGVPYRCKYIQLSPNTNYTISSRAGTTSNEIVLINNRQQPNVMPFFDLRNASRTITFKTDETGRLYIGSVNGDDVSTYNRIKECKIQIEVGSAESAYEPYRPITETDISFPSAVYGGTLDVVSGVLTVEWAIRNIGLLDWIISENGNYYYTPETFTDIKTTANTSVLSTMKCDSYKTATGASIYLGTSGEYAIGQDDSVHTRFRITKDGYETADELKTALDGVMIAYELRTPQTIQLTPQQINAIKGQNTLWSDADGSMTAVYLKKG